MDVGLMAAEPCGHHQAAQAGVPQRFHVRVGKTPQCVGLVGIALEQRTERERAFDMSYRGRGAQALRAGGRGLGLTLSRELIEAMGGSISLWSEEDRGSEVRVLLPVASEMAT
jgi:signal transduction histidine kinase